jgi:hypothetical protein
MTFRRTGTLILTVLAGILSCMVTLHGIDSATAVDFRFSPALSSLYCVLPISSFPAYLLARKFRWLAMLQLILAIAYLPVYSALNWRSCSSLDVCTSVTATVILTLKTHAALLFFGAAVCSATVLLMEKNSGPATSAKV